MYMDHIKIFVKNEKEVDTLTQTIKIYKKDMGIEFDIEKCAMIQMKSGKRETAEGIELQNQEIIRTLGEKENYKYLGILEAYTNRQTEMKEKI